MATESFFSNASLAYLASAGAGKDGKTYSIKPNDGSGDFTFSRGSNLAATRVGPDGFIEKGRENLLLQSNQFDIAWGLGTGTITSGQVGYDGTNDAWLLNSSANYLYQSISVTGVHTFSVYAKKATANEMRLRIRQTVDANVYFDLVNGVVLTTSGEIKASITDVSNGWYRCEVAFVASGTNTARIYSNDGDSIYIQDTQLEIGLAATDYIETEATTGKAGLLEDEPRFDYSGGATCPSLLLEPSRTNLVTQSEYLSGLSLGNSPTLTQNYAVSPEGVQNAVRIQDTDGSNYKSIYQSFSISAGSTYTISLYVKKATSPISTYGGFSFDFDFGTRTVSYLIFDEYNGTLVNAAGNGIISVIHPVIDEGDYWRFSATATDTGSNTILRATISAGTSLNGTSLSPAIKDYTAYGFQCEQASYPTSYIPNHSGGSVTREADGFTTLNITSLVTGTPFTWFLDLNEWQGSDTNVGNLYLSNSPSARIELRVRNDGYRILYNAINAGTSYPISASKTARKFCIKYDGSNFKLFRDGVLENTTASAGDTGWSGLTRADGGATLPLDQMLLFNEALSDADCITLTT